MFKYFLVLLLCCFFCIPIFAQNMPILELTSSTQKKQISLAPYCQVWVDSSLQKNLQEVLQPNIQSQFHPLDIENIEVEAKSIWLKIKLSNQNERFIKIGLQFGYFENLTIYVVDKTSTKKVAQRLFKRLEDVEYLVVPPKESTIYVHIIRSQPIYVSQVQHALAFMSLHGETYNYFWETDKIGLRSFALLFIGAISLMLFYNSILLIILKDRNYLFYIVGLFAFGIADFAERGLYEEWIAPQPPTYLMYMILLPIIFYVLSQLLFTRSFLGLPQNMPIANKVVLFLCFLTASHLLLVIFNEYKYLQLSITICAGISNLTILVISILAIWKVKRNITLYLIGNVLYNIGVIIYVLDLFQVIESNVYTVNMMVVGNFLEMTLFSLALANKINEAKQELIEQKLLKEQEKQAYVLEQNRFLEEKVSQRTIELQESNEELQQTLKTLALQTEELEKSNAVKDKLFSIIAHDLRSPLGALKGTLALLNIDALSKEELNAMTNDVKKRLDALDVTLTDLLQWAKGQMQSGAAIAKEKIELFGVVNQKIDFFFIVAENKQITLLNYVPKSIEVFADPNQIRTVIRNLIANAIKFTPANGRVTVGAQNDNDFVTIWVKDTGLGMTDEQINRLFENKTHFTTRGTAGEKGTGLGLLLCKDFVEQNGGKIWVTSELDKGSTFYFTLPKFSNKSLNASVS